MEAKVTSFNGFAGRQPLLISQLHGSSHCLFIASNRPLNEYNRVSFLHAILCYHKSTDSVTFSIDYGVMSVWKYINCMWRQWNSTAIKRMRKRLKPPPPLWAWERGYPLTASSQSPTVVVSSWVHISGDNITKTPVFNSLSSSVSCTEQVMLYYKIYAKFQEFTFRS